MTNVELVTRKLALVDEHVRRLRERRPAEVAAFRTDLLLQDAIALGLVVVVQESVDIALHIASDEGWELAPTYRDAFAVLAQHGVIDAPLATELGLVAQLRNRIAHGYASVDAERIWTELPGGIRSFEAFSRAIAKFLESIKAAPAP